MKLTPTSRNSWRKWLRAHHKSESEVWLVFYKRGTGKPTVSYSGAVEEAICFGWIDGIKRSLDNERYMHRFSPRRPTSRWSELNRRRAGLMETKGLMMPAGRKAVETARRKGTWDAPPAQEIDSSVPPELAGRLRRNKRADAFFKSLAPSHRRQYCLWINVAKRPETKARRVDEAIELLTRGEKLGMR